jgi:glutamate-ammonia-ligase adenylyltransferase
MSSSDTLELAVAAAADPDLARISMARVSERPVGGELLSRPDIMHRAAVLFGFARAAVDFFVAHPEELASLADPWARTKDELMSELTGDVARRGVVSGLRRFRRRATYRVALRDLSGASVDEVMAELSFLAEACLDVAVSAVPDAAGLAVVAMGKLGGRELNYASDVDVLFVHGGAGAEAQESASRAAAGVIGLLSEPTAEGVALRVDADLRPGGRSGPLSRSLAAMVDHYERHAATWERQALLKARPAAGDRGLAERFMDGVMPFVFPAVLPASAIEDVRSTKARIEELVRSRGKDSVEVKRGRGGIRDVEFAVQLLQLVHGRRYPRLREPGTLAALAALGEEGFVSADDAAALSASYRFLRALEHRLQMVRDLQTHDLPVDRSLLGPIARAMRLGDASELLAHHARHTETVRGLHDRLFYRPLLEEGRRPTPRRPRSCWPRWGLRIPGVPARRSNGWWIHPPAWAGSSGGCSRWWRRPWHSPQPLTRPWCGSNASRTACTTKIASRTHSRIVLMRHGGWRRWWRLARCSPTSWWPGPPWCAPCSSCRRRKHRCFPATRSPICSGWRGRSPPETSGSPRSAGAWRWWPTAWWPGRGPMRAPRSRWP